MARQNRPSTNKLHLGKIGRFLPVVGCLLLAIVVYQSQKQPDTTVSLPALEQLISETSVDLHIPIKKPSPSPSPKISVKEPGKSVMLPGAKWVPQTYNNCGPATTSMVLQYFGYQVSQVETKSHLRSNPDDKNVFTEEISTYLKNDYDIDSHLFYGGDVQLLKRLLANGFYIVVEDWLHPNEDIGHVTVIRGYDDERGVFIFDDAFLGINTAIPYEQFNQTQWKAFNREYLPVYRSASEPLLKAIMGENWDNTNMYAHAAMVARQEITVDSSDVYAWFNLGSSLYGEKKYAEARDAFARSEALGWPSRMLWYQIQPVQTYNKVGEYNKALALAQKGLVGNDSFAELHFESAVAYEGLGQIVQARSEAERAIQFDPGYEEAKELLGGL